MKIGVPINRLGFLKGLGSVVSEGMKRGHEMVIFMEVNENPKVGEEIAQDDVANIWQGVRIRQFDFKNQPEEMAREACDAIVGLDLLDLGAQQTAYDLARAGGCRLFSVSYLYETALRKPDYALCLEKLFYTSQHQKSLHKALYPNFFGGLSREWQEQHLVVSGCSSCDQLEAVDSICARKRFGVPLNVPVVLLMSAKMGGAGAWDRAVFGEGSKARKAWRACRAGRWDLLRGALGNHSYRDLVGALKKFCQRNGAFLFIKSRKKNKDPVWLREVADGYVAQDEPEYPYTSMQLLSFANLCVHFESATVLEAAFVGVPSLSIATPLEQIFAQHGEYSRRLRSRERGTMYNAPGVVTCVDYLGAADLLRRARLNDFTVVPEARAAYVGTFLGYDDTRAAHRVLDAVEAAGPSAQGTSTHNMRSVP